MLGQVHVDTLIEGTIAKNVPLLNDSGTDSSRPYFKQTIKQYKGEINVIA